AADGSAGTRRVQNLVDRHVRTLAATRWTREPAVVAGVAARLRERGGDLRGVRDQPAVAFASQLTRLGAELVERPVDELHHRSLDSGRGATKRALDQVDGRHAECGCDNDRRDTGGG